MESTRPLVSAIVPAYNHARYLQQRLDSVFGQTYPNMEVILLDDCSQDHTLDLLKAYEHHQKVAAFVANATNSGSPFKQWKKGVDMAKGEWVWIAESDDFAELEMVDKLLERTDEHTVIVYAHSAIVDEEAKLQRYWHYNNDGSVDFGFSSSFLMDGPKYLEHFLQYTNTIPNASGVLFRRSAWQRVGGIDTDLPYCADWLLWLKICLLGRVAFVAEPLNYFRRHEASVIGSSNANPKWKEADILLRQKWDCYLKRVSVTNFHTELLTTNKGKLEQLMLTTGLEYIYARRLTSGWRLYLPVWYRHEKPVTTIFKAAYFSLRYVASRLKDRGK